MQLPRDFLRGQVGEYFAGRLPRQHRRGEGGFDRELFLELYLAFYKVGFELGADGRVHLLALFHGKHGVDAVPEIGELQGPARTSKSAAPSMTRRLHSGGPGLTLNRYEESRSRPWSRAPPASPASTAGSTV